jgi:peptide deformylase
MDNTAYKKSVHQVILNGIAKKNLPSLKLIIYPNPILRQKSLPVEQIDEEIVNIGFSMLNLMYENHGIGLASNQAGILKRIIVMDLQRDENEEKQPLIMINPVILKFEDEFAPYEEGCLSLPQMKSEISRSQTIEVEYLDINGKLQQITAEGLFAICIQHEVDHINGVLFIDKLSKIKKDLILKKYRKQQKEEQERLKEEQELKNNS